MVLSDKWGNGFQAGLILHFNVKTIVLIYKRVVFPVQTGCLSEAIWWSARSCHCTHGLYSRYIKSWRWHSCGSERTDSERQRERERAKWWGGCSREKKKEARKKRSLYSFYPTYWAGESWCHNNGMQTTLRSTVTESLCEDRHGLLTIQYHGMDRKPQHSFRDDYSLQWRNEDG